MSAHDTSHSPVLDSETRLPTRTRTDTLVTLRAESAIRSSNCDAPDVGDDDVALLDVCEHVPEVVAVKEPVRGPDHIGQRKRFGVLRERTV